MKRLWIILAGVFAITALILFLRGVYDKAFISAALGAVAWFLGYRVQLRELVRANERREEPDESMESNEE